MNMTPEIGDTVNPGEVSTDTDPSWLSINWAVVNKYVSHMRSRIFVNSMNGNLEAVRSLQKLMLKSRYNYLYAIRKVTTNQGAKTPGVDGVARLTNAQKWQLFLDLQSSSLHEYSPPPVRRIYIPKPDGRWRPLGIPTLTDRIYQAIVLNALEPEWEAKFENCSYGFRPGRSVADAVRAVFVPLSMPNPGSAQWIVDCDIKGCFDNVDHGFLLSCLDDFPASSSISKWLKAGIFDNQVFADTTDGFPQGGIISPLLMNIALHGLQKALDIRLRPNTGHVRTDFGPGRNYVRYADDFVILTKTREDALTCVNIVEEFMATRGLTLKKSQIFHLTQPFIFVGFEFKFVPKHGYKVDRVYRVVSLDPYRAEFIDRSAGVILADPSPRSISSVKEKLKKIFVETRGKPASLLIKKCNAVIRGWAESKIAGTSTKTFSKLDSYLYKLCWNWAKRAHPKKTSTWIYQRYYKKPALWQYANWKWVFHAPGTDIFMLKFRWFKVFDHIKVRGNASVDDPYLKDYWIDLQHKRFLNRPVNQLVRRIDAELITSQDYLCPVCQSQLLDGTTLHRHHIVYRALKGPDSFSNLVIMHAECHAQIHYGPNKNLWTESLKDYKKLHPKKRVSFREDGP